MSDAIGQVYVEIGGKIDGLTSALNAVQAQLAKTKEKTEKWGESFQKVGKDLAIVGGAITLALSGITIAAANVGDKFDEMAAKTGISTETLSTMKLAADKSGISIDTVASGMKFLSAQMLETAGATDRSKTMLGALGISASTSNGQLRPMNDVLLEVADRFSGMEAGAIKTRMAVEIFGRAGMDMIPILNLGSKGLKDNEEAARRLGIEWSGKSAKSAADFADSMEDLKAANAGLGKAIGELLNPVMKDATGIMANVISGIKDWVKANPDLSQSILTVVYGVGLLATNAGAVLMALPRLVQGFGILAGALGTTAGALAAATAGITLLVGAAIVAYDAINKVIKATEQANEADYTAFERNRLLGEKLRAVADAAGITRAEFHKLTEKYGDNYAAMGLAIKRGDEGVVMQKALKDVGAEHAKTLESQTKKTSEFDDKLKAILDSLGKNKEATKTLKDELGLTFASDIQEKIDNINKAIVLFGKELPASEVDKLKREAAELGDKLYTGGLAFDFLKQRGRESLKVLIQTIEDEADPAFQSIIGMVDAIKTTMEDRKKNMPDIFGNIVPKAQESAKKVDDAWAGVFSDLSRGFGDTFQTFVESWSLDKLSTWSIDFRSFFKNLWGDIKDSFFRLVGDMVAKWTLDFLKGALTSGTAEAAASVAKSVTGMGTNVAKSIGDIASAGISTVTSTINTLSGIVSAATSVLSLLLPSKDSGDLKDLRNWARMTHDLTKEIHDWVREMWSYLLTTGQTIAAQSRDFLDIGSQLARDQISILENIRTNTQETVNILSGLPSYASGSSYVPQTTMAFVHRGERIIPANGVGPSRAGTGAGSSGGGGATQLTNNIVLDGRVLATQVIDIVDDAFNKTKRLQLRK